MEELTPPKRSLRFVPSDRLSDRKRALFPSHGSDSDSDLGMTPLERSSSPDRFQHMFSGRHSVNFRDGFSKINDNSSPEPERIEDTDDSDDGECFTFFTSRLARFRSASDQENVDPNKMTPHSSPQSLEIPLQTPTLTQSLINYTTLLESPSEILKTPHDSSDVATNVKVPKLVRKSLLDISNIDKSSLKRKSDSPIENKIDKNIKLDPYHHLKAPKARTALFPENIFPAKSFYPKTEVNKHEGSFRIDSMLKTKRSKKPDTIYLCNRNTKRNKKSFGMINAGVRHGIRKPKRKPALTKTQLLKAALNIVKNSPLNAILDNSDTASTCSENGVSLEQVQKMDFILKNVQNRTNSPSPALQVKPKEVPHEGYYSLKRPRSPNPDYGANKKFFKSSHPTNKATVTINSSIKLRVEDRELSLIEKQHKMRRSKAEEITFDSRDFSLTEEGESFSDLLKSLETEASPSGRIINDINSKLLSPTSLMCDLTSGLALDSPKAQISSPATTNQISALKKRISFPDNMSNESNKLFPIFYGKQNDNPKHVRENKHVKNIRKIWKPLSDDQTLIDAGQKRFGVTQCAECKCVYSLGEPEDEIMHFQHHNSIAVLRYNGWKHERVVNQFHNGKVIQVNPNDSKVWWKKVKDVLGVINEELGFIDVPVEQCNKKVYLCIMSKQIVGCLLAESKSEAHKMLPNTGEVDQCSEETFPVICGVSRLWVSIPHRKKGIATCLMNAMRSNFVYGHILSVSEIAFSAPTEAGKLFAAKYTKTDSFLIYTS